MLTPAAITAIIAGVGGAIAIFCRKSRCFLRTDRKGTAWGVGFTDDTFLLGPRAAQRRRRRKSRLPTKMRVRPNDTGGVPARHGVVQYIDTASKALGAVQGIYAAGKAVMPYVRPALTALAAAAV